MTFTVEVPAGMQTKAISDGTNVDQLIYEVWMTDGMGKTSLANATKLYQAETAMVLDGKVRKATLELDLMNDQNFTILFWAQVEGAGAYNTAELTGVTYAKNLNMYKANDESLAAFYAAAYVVDGKHVDAENKPASPTVTLYRPFAQLNLGTRIVKTPYTVSLDKSQVIVSDVPTKFNVATKEVTEPVSMTFSMNAVPNDPSTLEIQDEKFHWAGMNYMFAGDNVTVEYDILTKIKSANGSETTATINNTVSSVPLKENYRTNIVGNLLTSKVDYEIIVDADFNKPDLDPIYVWGGEVKAVTPVDENGVSVYYVGEPAELAWIAEQVNTGKNNFYGNIVRLDADIDFDGNLWAPIGSTFDKSFKGTFDGSIPVKSADGNYTISNFKVEGDSGVGLFGYVIGSIKNVNIENAVVSGHHYGAALVGYIYGNIENCHVSDSEIKLTMNQVGGKWDNGDKAGALAGYIGEGGYNISGNTATNVTVTAYRDFGGIVGASCPANFSDNSVSEVTLVRENPYNGTDAANVEPVLGRMVTSEKAVWSAEQKAAVEQQNDENEDSVEIVAGHFVGEGDAATTSFAEVLKNAESGDIINVPADVEVTLPSSLTLKDGSGTITITGSGESSVLAGTVGGGNNPGNYANNLHLVFKDITYKTANSGYSGGFGHAASVTFINCKIIGQMYAHSSAPHYFYDCTIDPLNGYLYTYASDCVFEGCTFEASAGKALQVYEDGTAGENTVTIKNCAFKAATQATAGNGHPVTGIDINSIGATFNVYVDNCSSEGFPVSVSGSNLWNIKGGADKVNLVIDGVYESRAAYTKLAGYPNIWVKDNNYVVFDKEGLSDLNAYFVANWCGNDTWNHEYHIGADIDATGFTWNSVYLNVGNNGNNGLVLDGNGHTISNLTINGSMFTGTPNGGDEGTTPGYIKNITIDNAVVTGDHWNAVFWGTSWGELVYEDVSVKNTSVTGACNVAVFLGGTALENPATDSVDYVVFRNCSVENCTLVATGKEGQDPNGASVFCGRAFANTSLIFDGTNIIDDATTITNENGLVGGKVYGYTTWYDGGFKGTGSCDQFKNWEGIAFESISSPDEMAEVLANAGSAGAGNTTIIIEKDIDMTGTAWNPIKIDGYHGADVVVIDGNDAVITGLTAPLFAGGFAGGSGIVIRNLTIADSDIVSKNTIGSGAFIESVDSMDEITLENCHLLNSTVTGGAGSRTGGLIGWTAGYSNVNDGPVKTYVTIKDCSVIDCDITCDGSVGGIYGHAGNNAWTYSTVENCTVKDCNLNSTDDGGWRVGVVVGTANVGELTMSNITESGNTLTQTGKTAPEQQSNLYGRFVPDKTGKLVIDGVEIK